MALSRRPIARSSAIRPSTRPWLLSRERTPTNPVDSPVTAPDFYALPIGAPLGVERPESVIWQDRCDVLVVGLGAAGACAAIEAARAGVAVIVTDRFGGGGASAKSGGVVYAGGGTPHQKAAGHDDNPDAMYEYLRREVGEAVSEATLRTFCAESAAMISWLESLGVEFDPTVPPQKTSYPADGYYLYYSGNETVGEYAGKFPPAPRGHRVKGAGLSGALLFRALRKGVMDCGATVMTQSAVRRLIVDSSNGAVLGAEVWQLPQGSAVAHRHRRLSRWAERLYPLPGVGDALRRRALAVELAGAEPRLVRARGGVVLSTGGFIFNRAMVARHAPRYVRNFRIGTAGCDGSGIRLGQSVGGDCAHLERVSAWRFVNPPLAWVRAMIVDAQGRRFCNEEVYGARLGYEMCEHHDGQAWLVLDSAIRREALRESLFGGLWAFQSMPAIVLMIAAPKRGRTIEHLARRLGADPPALRQTMEAYNRAASGAAADPMGKARDMMQPIEKPPFYALNVSADSRLFPCPALTLGGLRVHEETGAVVTADGRAIPGLYAAGRAAFGIASNHYVSGLALADCVWSGRRAGRCAASAAEQGATPTDANQVRATA
jgi:3-oxo-5alpha-steroid 4-dehydrogenase